MPEIKDTCVISDEERDLLNSPITVTSLKDSKAPEIQIHCCPILIFSLKHYNRRKLLVRPLAICIFLLEICDQGTTICVILRDLCKESIN